MDLKNWYNNIFGNKYYYCGQQNDTHNFKCIKVPNVGFGREERNGAIIFEAKYGNHQSSTLWHYPNILPDSIVRLCIAKNLINNVKKEMNNETEKINVEISFIDLSIS